ncbi:hypothetical protein DPMN_048141 [Dreissena polymorpha]|uniref:Uncharacterized protein n=1 Tax=Dreissena polymorpha TaxID=45954 RepID=A0A9D4I3Q2_DREPO|nr:hypothetical protein DPMN_048141 [Dreissena polymorpha]
MQDDGKSENVEIVVKSFINDNDGGDCVQNEYEQADYQNHAERIEDEVVDSSREKDNRKQDGNMYEFGGEAGHQIQLEYDANENIELNDSSTTSFDDGVNDIMFNFKSDHKIKLKDFKRGGSETTSTAEHNSISPDSSNSFPSSPTDSDNSELVTVMENEIKYKHDQENYSQDRAWFVQSNVVQDDKNRRETHNLDLYQNKSEEDVSDHDSHLAGSGHILASDIGITSGLDDFFGLNEPEFKDKTSDNENAGVINDDKFYISFTDSTTEDVPSNSVNDYDPFNLLTDNHEMNENVNAFEPLIGNNKQNEINDNDPFENLTKFDEIKDNVTDAFSTEDKIDSLNSSDKYNFFSNDEKDHVYNGASFPEQENLLTISSMPVESVSSIETPVEETVSGFYEINPEINTGEHVKEFISNSVCDTNLGDMETGFYVVNSEENDLKETVNFSIEKFAIDKANEIIKDIIPKDEMECSVSKQESSEAGVYEFQEPERENSDIMDDCVDVRISQTQGMDHTSYSDNSYQEGSGYLDNDAQSALLETKDPSIDTDQTQMDTGNSYSLLESLNCEQDVGQSIDSIGEPRDIINIAKELRVDQARASINNGETVHANEHQDDVISEYNVVVHENIDIVNAEEVNLHDDSNDLTTDINQDNKASIKGNNDTMETLNDETEVNTKINNDDIQHTESDMHDSSENDDSQGFNEVENVCPAAEEDDHIDETGFDPSELKNKRFMMKTGPGMPQISIDLASSVESSLSNDSDREAFIEVEAELTSDFTEDETEIHQTCNERDDDDADDKENIRPNMNDAESWMKVDTVTPAIDIKFDSENKSGSQRELILNDFDAEIQGTVLQNISIGSAFSPLESPCENAFEIGYQINPLIPEYNNNYEVDDIGDSTDEESGDLKKKPFVRFSNDIITDDHEIEKLKELADSLVSVAVQDALFEVENSTSEKDGPGDEINTKILNIADNLVKEVITEAIEIVGNQEPNTFVEFEIADAMKETGLEEDDSSDSDDGSSTTTEGSYQIDVSDDLILDSSPEKELEVEETHPSSEADPQLSLSISSPDDDVSVDNSSSIIDQSDPAIAPSFKKIPVDGSYRSFSFPDYEDHTLTSNSLDSNTGIVFEFAKGENDVNSRTFRQSSGLTLVKQDTIVPDIVISTEMSPEYDVEDITDYGADMSMSENTESKDELSDDETDKNINFVTTYVSFVEGEIASMNTTANLESHLGDEALDKGLPVNEIQDEIEEDNLVDFKLEDVTRRTLDLTTNETDAYLILSMSAVSDKEANYEDSVVANTVTVDLSSQVIRKQSFQNNDDTSGESDNIEVLVASSAQRQEVPADNFDTFDDGIQLTGMGEDDLRENTGAHIKDMIEKENFNEVSNQVDLGAGFVDHKSNNKTGEFDVYDAATFSNLSEKPIEISEYSENVVEKHIDHFVERLNFVEKTEHVQSFDDEVSEIVEQKQFSDVVKKADDNMAVTGDVWSFVEKPISNVELFDLNFVENCTDNDLAIEKVIDMPIEQKTVAKDESEEIIDDLQINNGETHISEAHDQMFDVEILNEVIEPQGDDIRVEEIGIENRSTQEQIKQDLLLNTETYNQLVDGFNESELDKLHDYDDKTYFTGTESETTQSHVIQDLSEGAEIHNQLVNNVNEDKSHLSGDDVNNEDITRRENAYDEDSTIVEQTKEFNDVEKADDNVAETNNVWSFVEKPILNVEQFDISFAENCADNDDLAIEKVIDMPVEHKTVSKDESVDIIDDLQINYGGTHISEAHDQMSDVEILNEVIWPHGDDIRVEEIGIENGSTQEQIEQDLLQNTETYDQLVDGFNETELDKLQDYEFLTDFTGTKSETTQSHVLQDLSEDAEIQNQLVDNVNENKSHTSQDDVNDVAITRGENAYDEDSTIVEPTKQFSDVVGKADDNVAETDNVWSFVEKPISSMEQFHVSFAENCADNYLAMEKVIDMPVEHKTVSKDESVEIKDDLQIKDDETHFSEAHDQSSDDGLFNEDIEPHSDVIRVEEIGIKNGSTQEQIKQDLLLNTETYNQLVDGFNESELDKLHDYDDKTYFTGTESETTQSHVIQDLSEGAEIHNQLVNNVNEDKSHLSGDDVNNEDITRRENAYDEDSTIVEQTKEFNDVEKADDNVAETNNVWSFVEKPILNVEQFDISFAENCADNDDLAIEKVIDMPVEHKTVSKDESVDIIDDLQINYGGTHISEAHDQMSDVEILNEVIWPHGDDIRVEEIGIENGSTQEQIEQDLLQNTETYDQLVDGFNETELDKLQDYEFLTDFTGTKSETTQSHVLQDLSEDAEIQNQLVDNVNENKSHTSQDDVNDVAITRGENAYDEDSTIVEPTKQFSDVVGKADDNVAETDNVWSFVEKPISSMEQFHVSFAENCADNYLAMEKVIDMPVEHKTVSKDESVEIKDDLQIKDDETHFSEAHDQSSDDGLFNEDIEPHSDVIRVEEIGIKNGSTQKQIEQDLLQNTETYDQLVDGFNETELDKLQDYEFLTALTGTKSETTQSHVLQDLSEYAEIQNQIVNNVNENKSHTSQDDVNDVAITRRENAYDENSTIVEPTKQFSDVVEKADDNVAETNNVWSFVEKPILHVEQCDVSFGENCADNYLAMENVIDMPVQHKTVAKDESVKIIDDLQIKDDETHFSEAHDQSSDDGMFNEDIEPHSDVIRVEEIGIKNGSTQKQIEQDLLQNTETYNQLVDSFNETELGKLQDYDDKTYFTETESETTQSHVFKELSEGTEIHNHLVDNVNESISHTSQDDDNNVDISRSENTKTQSQYVNDSLLDDETKKKMPLFKDESDEIEALMEVQPANAYTKEIEETTKEVYKPLIKDNSEDSGFSLGTRPKHRSSEYVTRKEIFYTTSGRMSVSIDSILDPPTDQELDIAANSQVTIEEEPSMVSRSFYIFCSLSALVGAIVISHCLAFSPYHPAPTFASDSSVFFFSFKIGPVIGPHSQWKKIYFSQMGAKHSKWKVSKNNYFFYFFFLDINILFISHPYKFNLCKYNNENTLIINFKAFFSKTTTTLISQF